MSVTLNNSIRRPRVCLVGALEHPDFRESVALLRDDAEIISVNDRGPGPDLIIAACSRPSEIAMLRLHYVRQSAPLAGAVAVLGSWCEGFGRTGPPIPDMLKLYWHQFAPWWKRQVTLRVAGCCPEWARPASVGSLPASGPAVDDVRSTQYSVPVTPNLARPTRRATSRGLVVLATPHWETADSLSDVLQSAGFATVWQPSGRPASTVRGIAAGIWNGGQLNDHEAANLQDFSRRLARENAPVIAFLDYPRRDRCDLAREAGAAAVLGKPWINADLVALIREATSKIASVSAA